MDGQQMDEVTNLMGNYVCRETMSYCALKF